MWRWTAIVFSSAILIAISVLAPKAVRANALPAKADVLGPRYITWIAGVKPEALEAGVSAGFFDQVFADLKPDPSLPDLILPWKPKAKKPTGTQAEFSKTPEDYLATRHFNYLLAKGRALAAKHAATLARAEKAYGVPKEILLAIWGRETSFGSYKPKRDMLQALVTQAYLGRRATYFRSELIKGLKMVEEGHASRATMRASWAGATGLTQFMPSNFYDYAVDFDGDGKRDIWRSIPDVMASTAKSLTDNGWVSGRSWGYEVVAPPQLDCTLEGERGIKPLREWVKLGFARTRGRTFPDDLLDEPVYLLMPAGTYGPAFLMTRNFLVIKTYNFANLYALFVGHLADRIGGGASFEGKWQKIRVMREDKIVALQEALKKLGYEVGKIDGKVGPKTRNAVGALQKARRLKTDCFPTRGLLATLLEPPS